jgi:hypothetical protein
MLHFVSVIDIRGQIVNDSLDRHTYVRYIAHSMRYRQGG